MSALRIPSNAAAFGLFASREELGLVRDYLRLPRFRNADMRALARLFLATPEFAYLIVAGQPWKKGGAVGGMARDWSKGLALYSYANDRLDALARKGPGFASMWVLALSPEQQQEIETHTALRQGTEGSA